MQRGRGGQQGPDPVVSAAMQAPFSAAHDAGPSSVWGSPKLRWALKAPSQQWVPLHEVDCYPACMGSRSCLLSFLLLSDSRALAESRIFTQVQQLLIFFFVVQIFRNNILKILCPSEN